MASQTHWQERTQAWDTFVKTTEAEINTKNKKETPIADFCKNFFAQETQKKAEAAAILQELLSFAEPLVKITDHPLIRYTEKIENQEEQEEEQDEAVSFLDMVAKVQSLAGKELTTFTNDPIFKGCNRIAYAGEDPVSLQPIASLPQVQEIDWMDKSLASNAIQIIKEGKEVQKCRDIFDSLKAYMQRLKGFYDFPVLKEWAFYNACMIIFPHVTTDATWQEKIQALALAVLTDDECQKMQTPKHTPVKKSPAPTSRINSPTLASLQQSSEALRKELAKGPLRPINADLAESAALSTQTPSSPEAEAAAPVAPAALPAKTQSQAPSAAPAASVPSEAAALSAPAARPTEKQYQAPSAAPAASVPTEAAALSAPAARPTEKQYQAPPAAPAASVPTKATAAPEKRSNDISAPEEPKKDEKTPLIKNGTQDDSCCSLM